MLGDGIEWGDPLPRQSAAYLDPELVSLLVRRGSIISPDPLHTTLARVHLDGNITVDGTVLRIVWIAQLHTGEYIRLLVDDAGRVYQSRISRAMDELFFSLPTDVASDLRRQVMGQLPYGSEVRVERFGTPLPTVGQLTTTGAINFNFQGVPASDNLNDQYAVDRVVSERIRQSQAQIRRNEAMERLARFDDMVDAVAIAGAAEGRALHRADVLRRGLFETERQMESNNRQMAEITTMLADVNRRAGEAFPEPSTTTPPPEHIDIPGAIQAMMLRVPNALGELRRLVRLGHEEDETGGRDEQDLGSG